MKEVDNCCRLPIKEISVGYEYLSHVGDKDWNRILSHSDCGCARVRGPDGEVFYETSHFVPDMIRLPDETTDRLDALEQRVEALESSGVSRKCTCSKCTGLPDVMEYYKESDIEQEATPAIPPTPSEVDYLCAAVSLHDAKVRAEICAMHHTITAEERAILYALVGMFTRPSLTPSKKLMNEALPIIRRLANTLPVKEEQS